MTRPGQIPTKQGRIESRIFRSPLEVDALKTNEAVGQRQQRAGEGRKEKGGGMGGGGGGRGEDGKSTLSCRR